MAHRTLPNSSSLLLSPKPSRAVVTWLLLVCCDELATAAVRLLSCCQSLKQMPKLILVICQGAKLVLGLPFPFILMGNLESSHHALSAAQEMEKEKNRKCFSQWLTDQKVKSLIFRFLLLISKATNAHFIPFSLWLSES